MAERRDLPGMPSTTLVKKVTGVLSEFLGCRIPIFDKLILGILAWCAEFESHRRSERMADAYRSARRRGQPIRQCAPLGFRWVGHRSQGTHQLRYFPEEREHMRLCYELCIEHDLSLTGTLIGGYAEQLRPLLFRLAPGSLVEEGFRWQDAMPFNECYGRIETVITERSDGGEENRQSRGSTSKTKYCRPGIMPTLFGAHLIGNAVFLGLQEMNAALPSLKEYVVPIEMDPELRVAYDCVQSTLRSYVKQMLARRDKRMLGTMLQTLMAYPDYPFAWSAVGYHDKSGFVPVCEPPNLSPAVIRAKEKWFLDVVQQEAMLGRQVWGYVQLNGKHDVESRLAELLRRHDFRVKVLKHTIPLKDREEWIDRNCQDVDVVLSHPRLVETGLDLFSKSYLGHNFCSLAFYETGYVLPTMRQASRRAWRLMQPKECKVFYAFYQGTMQERAMELMGKKLLAAEALEGKFSSEGLVAMAGDDGIEMAMARSLAENMDEQADRSWQEALDEGKQSKKRAKPKSNRELTVIE